MKITVKTFRRRIVRPKRPGPTRWDRVRVKSYDAPEIDRFLAHWARADWPQGWSIQLPRGRGPTRWS